MRPLVSYGLPSWCSVTLKSLNVHKKKLAESSFEERAGTNTKRLDLGILLAPFWLSNQ
jgi:hypothetical protein